MSLSHPLSDTPSTSDADVLLTALGKTWGKLVRGRFLEVKHYNGQVAYIDLCESAQRGRSVVVWKLPECDTETA
jgi:hypothetical protein